MDGEFPNVEYLGCSILAKTTGSGLGSIQRALKERYIDYRKNSKSKRQGQPVHLKVGRDGLTVLFPMSRPGEANQMFYDFPSINYFEAVRFVANREGDKKFSSAFLPLNPHRAPMSGPEKLFTPLEKKHQNLLKLQHPAMLACVMRRTQGIKALECHYFVTENDREAIDIVACMESMTQSSPPRGYIDRANRYGADDRGYPRSEEPDVLRRMQDDRGNNYPGERFSGGYDESRMPREDEDVDRLHGNNQGSNYLRQQDFLGGPPGGENRFENRGPEMERNVPYAPQRRYGPENEDRNFRHERQGSGSSGGGRYADNRGFIHERQRSGEGLYGENRGYIHERQRSGEGRGMFERQNSDERHFADPERFARSSGRDEISRNRGPSPGRQGNREAPVPSTAPKPGHGPLKSSRAGLPRQPFDPSEPIASMSNIESRQGPQEPESRSKPVAKVPPHLVAGVKVLPTNLLAALPKKVEAEPSRFGDDDNPYDNALSRRDFYAKKNPNYDQQGFEDFKGKGYEARKSDISDYRRSDKGYSPPDIVPRFERGNSWEEYERNRIKYGEENHHEDLLRKSSSGKSNVVGNPHSEPINENAKHWSYESEFRKFNKGHSEDRDSYNVNRDDHTNELPKMFNDKIGPHRVGDVGPSHDPPDFQESLGYLP